MEIPNSKKVQKKKKKKKKETNENLHRHGESVQIFITRKTKYSFKWKIPNEICK